MGFRAMVMAKCVPITPTTQSFKSRLEKRVLLNVPSVDLRHGTTNPADLNRCREFSKKAL